MRPTEKQQTAFRLIRRRRREQKEAPREASPDAHAVPEDSDEDDDDGNDEDEESEEEEAREVQVVGTKHVPKAPPATKKNFRKERIPDLRTPPNPVVLRFLFLDNERQRTILDNISYLLFF